MKGNHVLISRITTTKDIAYIDFTNISQQYSDLKIVVSMRSTDSAWYDYPQMYLNNDWDDGLGNYTYRRLYTQTNTVYSGSGTSMSSPAIGSAGNGATANTFGSLEYYIFNYSSTTQYKNISCDAVGANNSSSVVLGINASTRQSNQAIYRIVFTAGLGSIKAGSSFSIYGIANAVTTPTTSPKAFGGDIVTTDGTYWYHVFLSSGAFIPQTTLNCDYLIVGGGGGGTYGGGGSGGLKSSAGNGGGGAFVYSPLTLNSNQSYPAIVGAGGSAGTNTSSVGASNGTTSSFSIWSGFGGGRGGIFAAPAAENGRDGGSGGGGGGADTGNTPGAGGGGVIGHGYGGGSGVAINTTNGGGGGGGAMASGGNATASSFGGQGGIGKSLSGFATPTGTGHLGYYAGGGSGGGSSSRAGGLGGGGAGGASNSVGSAAIRNTGGGGGGGGNTTGGLAGGTGASGIIIVMYPV